MDLRQRRKLDTTRLIHEAAVALARDNGLDGVTIEDICKAAGISQRTFFNYFPFKEAAFVFPPPVLSSEAAARFVAANGDMMSELIDLMAAQAVEMTKGPWGGSLIREIAIAHPRVVPLQMAEFQKFESELAKLIAKRLGAKTGDVRCAALAGAFIGAARTATDRWRQDERADLPRLVREGLEGFVETVRSSSSK
ncbi:MAG: TetR family transcriptional regulator [Devosia sp.]|nr:TetR family transcriptional regulator [Devosia sp.]